MKYDPYKHETRYFNWKAKLNNTIPNISKINSNIIIKYIFDMEMGLNISNQNKKGARSFARLNNLRQRLIQICRMFESRFNLKNIAKITEEQLFEFFTGMRNGTIKTEKGHIYKSTPDYIKVFKAFWHWHQKVNKKNGNGEILDITSDLDTSRDKPKWVYLDEEQVRKLIDNARPDYKVLIMFLLDSGIRAPTELMNIKVSDLLDDFKVLNIRDEISKTFGRKIKLLLSSDLIREYIKEEQLNQDDYLFTTSPSNTNKYLRRLGKNVFGDNLSLAGQKYSELTMYDFRHISCCYWLPRYKSESALKFRFGWKKSDKIHYYSEMLGMRDTIQEEDLLVDVTKTELEKRIFKTEGENEVLKDRIEMMERQMKRILGMVDGIDRRVRS